MDNSIGPTPPSTPNTPGSPTQRKRRASAPSPLLRIPTDTPQPLSGRHTLASHSPDTVPLRPGSGTVVHADRLPLDTVLKDLKGLLATNLEEGLRRGREFMEAIAASKPAPSALIQHLGKLYAVMEQACGKFSHPLLVQCTTEMTDLCSACLEHIEQQAKPGPARGNYELYELLEAIATAKAIQSTGALLPHNAGYIAGVIEEAKAALEVVRVLHHSQATQLINSLRAAPQSREALTAAIAAYANPTPGRIPSIPLDVLTDVVNQIDLKANLPPAPYGWPSDPKEAMKRALDMGLIARSTAPVPPPKLR